jgi:hypothetical protein
MNVVVTLNVVARQRSIGVGCISIQSLSYCGESFGMKKQHRKELLEGIL